MGCGCNKRPTVVYRVDFNNGSDPQQYDTISEAKAALTAAGNPAGSSFKAVAK